jgi:hypothetical protein
MVVLLARTTPLGPSSTKWNFSQTHRHYDRCLALYEQSNPAINLFVARAGRNELFDFTAS